MTLTCPDGILWRLRERVAQMWGGEFPYAALPGFSLSLIPCSTRSLKILKIRIYSALLSSFWFCVKWGTWRNLRTPRNSEHLCSALLPGWKPTTHSDLVWARDGES
jgi:hypothetical protein